MGKLGRPSAEVVLGEKEKNELEHIVRSHTAENRMVLRASIVLMCSEKKTNRDISASLGIDEDTVSKWRNRFSQHGMEGLRDEQRSGKPARITAEDRLRMVDALVKPPEAMTHWSIRDLSEELKRQGINIGKSQLQRIIKELDLKPHQYRMWLNSNDPDFEKKQADIIGLYLTPPKNALVISVDEKTQMQALSHEFRRPMVPGSPEQIDSHYVRHGVLSLYAALFIHSGTVVGRTENRHTHSEFISFLELIDQETSGNQDIHIICDNLSAHKTQEVEDWFSLYKRFHIHFTATHASWLNQVELWFGILGKKVLERGEFTSKDELAGKIMKFIEYYNRTGKPFKWTSKGKVLSV